MMAKRFLTLLLTALLISAVVSPQPADAGRGLKGLDPKKAIRKVGHAFKHAGKAAGHTIKFVAEIQGKLEYRMKEAGIPPFVAVLGADLYIKKFLFSDRLKRIHRRGKEINKKIKDQKKKLKELDRCRNDLKKFYRQEAKNLEESAYGLLSNLLTLSKRLVAGEFRSVKDGSVKAGVKEFNARFLATEMMAGKQYELANQLKKQAKQLSRKKFIKLISTIGPKSVAKEQLSGSRKIGITSLTKELLKSTNARVVIAALTGQININTIKSDIVEQKVDRELNIQGAKHKFDAKALKESIKRQVKEKLKKDRAFLRNKKNLYAFIKTAVAKEVQKQKLKVSYLKSQFKAKPQKGIVPLSVKFDANASEGKIKKYKWNFGDGTDPGYGKTTSHTYKKKGSYEAELTITGENSIESLSKIVTITVLPKPTPPSIALSVDPIEVSPGEEVTIIGKLILGSIKKGTLTITCKVGQKSLKSKVIKGGELDYDHEIKRVYTVPKDAEAGKREVTSTPTIKLGKEDAAKFKQSTSVGKTSTTSFMVKESPNNKFIGTIKGVWSSTGEGEWNVKGNFVMHLSEGGEISGSYSGDDSGSLSGNISPSGELNVTSGSGSVGSGIWSGSINVESDGALSGSGSWNAYDYHGGWRGE
ncbi:PKD domain-containing protein [Sulfurovum sp. CS9]|uniref:PKD domain-containing protein n=1 Tax=Sulfurovum sp. CS9 TaxID=3391146 RepID=UPI0039ECE053